MEICVCRRLGAAGRLRSESLGVLGEHVLLEAELTLGKTYENVIMEATKTSNTKFPLWQIPKSNH